MNTSDIILLAFGGIIFGYALRTMVTNRKRRGDGKIGYFEEIEAKTEKTKFSSTTLFSFLCLIFWFMSDLIFLGIIADNFKEITWQFLIAMLIINFVFAIAVFAPKHLKNIQFVEMLKIMKPKE